MRSSPRDQAGEEVEGRAGISLLRPLDRWQKPPIPTSVLPESRLAAAEASLRRTSIPFFMDFSSLGCGVALRCSPCQKHGGAGREAGR